MKKTVYTFLIKKTTLYGELCSKEKKLLAIAKKRIGQNPPVYCLKIQAIFVTRRTYK